MYPLQQQGRHSHGFRFDIERVVGDPQYRRRVMLALRRRKVEDKMLSGNGRMLVRAAARPA